MEHVTITFVLLLLFFLAGILVGNKGRPKETNIRITHEIKDLGEKTELLYDSLFNYNQDGILVVDIHGNVIDGNPAICKMSGYTLEEFKKIELPTFVVDEDLEKKFYHTHRALSGLAQEYTITVKNKSGDQLQVMIKMVPIIEHENVVGLFEIIKDITEAKKMEEMMYHSDKLNAVGQLAAGVAHEIRNPLTSLKGFLQISKPQLQDDYVKIMEDELERINQIVGEFLYLSKPQKISFKTKNITEIINDVVQFIQPEALLTGVEIHKHYTKEVPMIHCEDNQLKQVFINLLKNAMEAMASGGNIHIYVSVGKTELTVNIKDEGKGITKDTLEKIGHPFYTTKENGNGLGLVVTQRIIEAHGGAFSIESEVGRGTTAKLIFPLYSDQNEEPKD